MTPYSRLRLAYMAAGRLIASIPPGLPQDLRDPYLKDVATLLTLLDIAERELEPINEFIKKHLEGQHK